MNPTVRWAGVAALALAVLLGWRAIRPADTSDRGPAPASAAASGQRSGSPADRDASRERAGPDAGGTRRMMADWNRFLRLAASGTSPDEMRERLAETRAAWLQMDPGTVAGTIGNLLRGGADRPLGMPFEVGNQGFLAGWPSLRVFLLDVLAGSDPEAAASIAREVLDDTRSVDEYVVALRSLTRDGTGRATDAELFSRFEHMLAQDEWRDHRAFAEAFDLARLLGSEAVVSRLCGWDGNPRLRTAALHELAAERPAAVVASASALTRLDPADRASLMARADPADPGQAAAVEAYLRDPALDPSEASAFLERFPLRSATTGHRLYGPAPKPFEREQVLAGDHAALRLADEWLADPGLASLQPDLEALRKRIVEWLPDDE